MIVNRQSRRKPIQIRISYTIPSHRLCSTSCRSILMILITHSSAESFFQSFAFTVQCLVQRYSLSLFAVEPHTACRDVTGRTATRCHVTYVTTSQKILSFFLHLHHRACMCDIFSVAKSREILCIIHMMHVFLAIVIITMLIKDYLKRQLNLRSI